MPSVSRSLLAVGCALVLVLCLPVLCGAGDEEQADRLDPEKDSKLLREAPPTPESLARLAGQGHLTYMAVRNAVAEAQHAEMLNVLEHIAELGLMTPETWRFLRPWLRCDACVKARFVSRKPRTNERLISLDHEAEVAISEVFFGEVVLRRDNTPLHVTVKTGAMATERFEREFLGKDLAACIRVDSTGIVCTNWWIPTGREQAVLARIAPLHCREPHRLLEYMRSEDPTLQWLGAAQVVMACRSRSEAVFARESSAWLNAERLRNAHERILSQFDAIAPHVAWSAEADGFIDKR